MKRFLLSLLMLTTLSFFLSGQTTREDEARDDLKYSSTSQDRLRQQSDFGGQLWYGAGAQLGFSSFNGNSFFQVGISPIVGYKLNNILSVGPRASITYNNVGFGSGIDNISFWTWSSGVFARAKVFQQFFVHGEYSLVSDVDVFSNGDQLRVTRTIPFLGGGFQQGGGPGMAGFEILILFRLSQRDRFNDIPYEFRTGFNYNF
jgi:hypothetical protein